MQVWFDIDIDISLLTSDYKNGGLPFIFIFGLSTSAETIHKQLPQSVSSILRTEKFQLQSSKEYISSIVHEVLSPMFSPISCRFSFGESLDFNWDVEFILWLKKIIVYVTFQSNLSRRLSMYGLNMYHVLTHKYTMMLFFYCNPLSFLARADYDTMTDLISQLTDEHVTYLKKLTSNNIPLDVRFKMYSWTLKLSTSDFLDRFRLSVVGLKEYILEFQVAFSCYNKICSMLKKEGSVHEEYSQILNSDKDIVTASTNRIKYVPLTSLTHSL